MAKPKYDARTPANVLDAVRFQVANHTGKKKSNVTAKTKLNGLDGDGIFDVTDALHDQFGIKIPRVEAHDDLVCKNVQALVDYVLTAPMAEPKFEKAGSMKYPELTNEHNFNAEEIAGKAAMAAISGLKDKSRSYVFTRAANEVQLRDAKTDSVIAIIEVIANHRNVGFNLLHFQHMADTLEDTVLMASFTLGTPYTIAQRYEMAKCMGIAVPESMEGWAVATLVQRMAFFPMIAQRLKKLVGNPKANHVEIVSEIANIAGFEFEDEVFDVYTNINKMEKGDDDELAASLDAFFTQEFFLEDYAPLAKAKVCKPVQTEPEDSDELHGREYDPVDESIDFRFYDLLNGISTTSLAHLFAHAYSNHQYTEILESSVPVSQKRTKMVDRLVNDWSLKNLADAASNGPNDTVRQIGIMLGKNV